MALTRRQREMLDFVADFIRTRRYSPSLEEIAAHFGLSSVATVHKHVSNLEKKGFIKRSWNRSRSIDLVTTELPGMASTVAEPAAARGSGRATLAPAALTGADVAMRSHAAARDERDEAGITRLSLLGRVAAGRPIEAVVDPETIAVPSSMVGRHPCYVLQVKGDSMIGEQIRDGDFVIVEERQVAREGEKVIALIGDSDVTLKTYHRESDGSVRLDPANPNHDPIRVRDGSFRIQGVVIGVMRKYRH